MIVCLCGSTAFLDDFQRAQLEETLAGRIVLSIGCSSQRDALQMKSDSEVKIKLDELHLRKIDLADEVLFINVGGYIGDSTRRELAYSLFNGKVVRFVNEVEGERYMEEHAHELGKFVAEFISEAS